MEILSFKVLNTQKRQKILKFNYFFAFQKQIKTLRKLIRECLINYMNLQLLPPMSAGTLLESRHKIPIKTSF